MTGYPETDAARVADQDALKGWFIQRASERDKAIAVLATLGDWFVWETDHAFSKGVNPVTRPSRAEVVAATVTLRLRR